MTPIQDSDAVSQAIESDVSDKVLVATDFDRLHNKIVAYKQLLINVKNKLYRLLAASALCFMFAIVCCYFFAMNTTILAVETPGGTFPSQQIIKVLLFILFISSLGLGIYLYKHIKVAYIDCRVIKVSLNSLLTLARETGPPLFRAGFLSPLQWRVIEIELAASEIQYR
jgi:hypothetical protein